MNSVCHVCQMVHPRVGPGTGEVPSFVCSGPRRPPVFVEKQPGYERAWYTTSVPPVGSRYRVLESDWEDGPPLRLNVYRWESEPFINYRIVCWKASLMGSARCFVGVDPGPTTGLAVAYWDEDSWMYPGAYQCDAGSALALLGWLVKLNAGLAVRAQVEEFRPGTGAGARGPHAQVTRTLADTLREVLARSNASVCVRPAAAVKPWATDKRLERAGLMGVCRGQGHAGDAMRHLLFCAVHDGGVPDPLSRRVS